MQKKILTIILVLAMLVGIAIPVFAAGNDGTTNDYVGGVGVKVDKNNANFHCNSFGGNGRVWPEEAINRFTKVITKHDFKKTPFMFYFDKVDGTTKWTLNHVRDEKNNVKIGDVICPVCGSTQWISYSNNSGAPDGKNIQLQHPLTSIILVKAWLDAEGNPSKGATAKFNIEYTVGTKSGKMNNVSPGTIDKLPAGTYVIKELDIKNYTLIDILTRAGFVVNLDERTATIIITPAMALADDKVTVTFTNQKDPFALIIKEWDDNNPGKLTAYFDIYAMPFEEGDEPVVVNARAGVEYFLDEGEYMVREQLKSYTIPAVKDEDGSILVPEKVVTYKPQPDQYIEVKWGEIATVKFVNEPDVVRLGSFSFEKKVEGVNVVFWLAEKLKIDALLYDEDLDEWYLNPAIKVILDGLKFTLTNVDYPGFVYGPMSPGDDGIVYFDDVEPGTYRLTEEVVAPADKIFKTMSPIDGIIIGTGHGSIVLGGTLTGNIDGPDILPGDKFTVHNGYGDFRWGYDDSGIGYPGLNATGHIFYIAVDNVRTGERLDSYCANAGSTAFGPGPYLVGHSMVEEDWVMAFNYIYDNYGDLNDNRVITQVITWALLGAVDVYDLDQTKLKDDEKAAIIDVWENYDGYVGQGCVVDVLFLVDENTPLNEDGSPNYTGCQPQIVPIFGTFFVENEPEIERLGGVSFNKVLYGGKISFEDIFNIIGVVPEFAFDLFKIVDGVEVYVDTYPTDPSGVVLASDLEPGDYVFKEVFGFAAAFHPEGLEKYGWGFVWDVRYPNGDDGLYFTMPADGSDAVWPPEYELDDDGNPTVNNILLCKHNIMWTAWDNLDGKCIPNPNGDGFLTYQEGTDAWDGGGVMIYGFIPATCDKPAYITLTCSHEGEQFGTGFEISPALGHDVDYDNPTPIFYIEGQPAPGNIVYGCTRCGHTVMVYDLALWLELVGWDDPWEGY